MAKAEKSHKQENKKGSNKPKPLSDAQMDKVAGGANKTNSSSSHNNTEDGKGG